jgi:hypothetical protein
MDIICARIDAIETSYDNPSARDSYENHEALKFLAVCSDFKNHYKVTCTTLVQEQAINTWCALCIQGNSSRNRAFNGWTIPLPLSHADCTVLRDGLLSGEIKITENGTPGEIQDRRQRKVWSAEQMRRSIAEDD